MADPETTLTTKSETVSVGPVQGTSSILGVSIQAWIAVQITVTVCFNQLFITLACLWQAVESKDFSKVGTFTTVGEPLYSMAFLALGFYFGQKKNDK